MLIELWKIFLISVTKEADVLGDTYISLEHFLLVFAQTKNLPESIQNFFRQSNFTKNQILSQMQKLRKGKTVKEKSAEKQYQILEKYCQNITDRAREGKLDPVIGRHEEIRRVIQIFHEEQKIIRFLLVNRVLVKLQLLKELLNELLIMMFLKV